MIISLKKTPNSYSTPDVFRIITKKVQIGILNSELGVVVLYKIDNLTYNIEYQKLIKFLFYVK